MFNVCVCLFVRFEYNIVFFYHFILFCLFFLTFYFCFFPKRIKCIVDMIKTEACSLIDGLNRLDVHDLFAANNLCKMLFYN